MNLFQWFLRHLTFKRKTSNAHIVRRFDVFALLITSVYAVLAVTVGGWNTLRVFEDILRVIFGLYPCQPFEVAAVVCLGPVLD